MAKIRLTEAEAFVPVTLKTLYNHRRVGKLSTTKDALGNICVDPAELERVYGQLHLNWRRLSTLVLTASILVLLDDARSFVGIQ